MNYLESFREMVSLRGLRESTLKTYLTYITAYLDYVAVILCKKPEDVSWQEMRTFVQWMAYRIIKQLNNELKEKGYITVAGRVSRKYYEERTCRNKS